MLYLFYILDTLKVLTGVSLYCMVLDWEQQYKLQLASLPGILLSSSLFVLFEFRVIEDKYLLGVKQCSEPKY